MTESSERIDHLQHEQRSFAPPPEFAASANVDSVEDARLRALPPEQFWKQQAQRLGWKKPWHTVHRWDPDTPSAEWFVGGRLKVAINCAAALTSPAPLLQRWMRR